MIRNTICILTGLAALVAAGTASAAERTVTLAADNMTCVLCPPIVKTSLTRVLGVANAEVSAERHTATVVFDDSKTTIAALDAATTNAACAKRAGRWR